MRRVPDVASGGASTAESVDGDTAAALSVRRVFVNDSASVVWVVVLASVEYVYADVD